VGPAAPRSTQIAMVRPDELSASISHKIIEDFCTPENSVKTDLWDETTNSIVQKTCTLSYYSSPARPNFWTKSRQVLRVFLLAIHSHLCTFALRCLFKTHATSYSFYCTLYMNSGSGYKWTVETI